MKEGYKPWKNRLVLPPTREEASSIETSPIYRSLATQINAALSEYDGKPTLEQFYQTCYTQFGKLHFGPDTKERLRKMIPALAVKIFGYENEITINAILRKEVETDIHLDRRYNHALAKIRAGQIRERPGRPALLEAVIEEADSGAIVAAG